MFNINFGKRKKIPQYREGRSRWYYLFRGIITSFLITIPVFVILSVALTLGSMPERYISPAVFATTVLSIVCASFLATAGSQNSGWFNGSLVGFLYMLIIILIRWIIERSIYLNKETIILLLSGVLIGTIGGLVGINLNFKKIKNK
ncbi:MAG: TIGR04086 family membrane protein, partial [Clostridiales bacterium]|nr:TIGR04086 family membrane protein [Clostridiales bacterium]